MSKTIEVPFQRLDAQIATAPGGTAGDKSGSLRRVTWYTGATVMRGYFEPYKLTMSMKPENVRMERLASGKAPVLNGHMDYSAQDVIGVVESAWIEHGKGLADIRFSEREDVKPIAQDVDNGILRNASVGVKIHKLQDVTGDEDKIKSYLAVDWEPMEVSIVPIGADPDAGFRARADSRVNLAEIVSAEFNGAIMPRIGANAMAKETVTNAGHETRTDSPAVPVAPASPTKEELAEEELQRVKGLGTTSEHARVIALVDTCKACGLEPAFAERHIRAGTGIDEFRRLAIDERALRASQQPEVRGVHAELKHDEADIRRLAMAGALLERFEPGRWKFDDKKRLFTFHKAGGQELFEGSRQYTGLSLLDVAKECLSDLGISWRSKNRTEIATLAFQSTSDFPGILANVANKSLRAGYEMSESQWKLIAARRTAPDFKTVSELTLDGSARLELVKEDGEFHRGKLVEGKETWQLATYGKIVGITRQAIINDDLGAFTRTPFLLGQEVAMLEADMVIAVITDNAALADGYDLFDATHHSNVTASGGPISISTLGDARVLLMTQKLTGGKPMNITPRFLLAPATQGQLAEQYCSPNYQATQPSNINPLAGRLVPVIESRLDPVNTYAWYLFGDPNSPNGTVVVYAYLEGQEGPYTENRQGFDIDGVEVKIRHDFAAAAVDYRGAVKNAGH